MDSSGNQRQFLSLRGRRALITGASLGIGRAIAQWFSAHGAAVAMHHCSALDEQIGHGKAATELLASLQQANATSFAIDLDLARPDSGREVARIASEGLGGVDIVVFCASAQVRQPFDQIEMETVRRLMRINFESSIEILQALVPAMCRQHWGRVISIGSVNQVRPHEELGVYAALKAAQHNLIVGGARRHTGDGITMNTISPGLIATPRNEWRRVDADEWRTIEHRANPMHRAGLPDEVAGFALLLASDAGAFVTGADIPVDGGARL